MQTHRAALARVARRPAYSALDDAGRQRGRRIRRRGVEPRRLRGPLARGHRKSAAALLSSRPPGAPAGDPAQQLRSARCSTQLRYTSVVETASTQTGKGLPLASPTGQRLDAMRDTICRGDQLRRLETDRMAGDHGEGWTFSISGAC